jgi:Tol biopolymer transport system component
MKRSSLATGLCVLVAALGVAVAVADNDPGLCQAGFDPLPEDAPPRPRGTGQPSADHGIWVVGPDGTNPTRLATEVAPAWLSQSLAWSPDGNHIAYGTDSSLAVARADGTGARILTHGVDPAWSGDGTRIVFSADSMPESSDERLEMMNADGSGRRVLTARHGFRMLHASWSPDGNRMAFSAIGGYYGSPAGQVCSATAVSGDPAADSASSPDGSRPPHRDRVASRAACSIGRQK